MSNKLDRSKPYQEFVEQGKVKGQSFVYYEQGGIYFNPANELEIPDLDAFLGKKKVASTTATTKAPVLEDVIKCKYCGKTYKMGDTDATKARAVKFMESHLSKHHPEALEPKELEDGLRNDAGGDSESD